MQSHIVLQASRVDESEPSSTEVDPSNQCLLSIRVWNMKPVQSDRFSCSISAHAEVGPCLEYATFSIRRFNIIVICPRCLIQSYSSLGVAAPKHFRAWKATANRTDFAAQSVILISVTHLLPRLLVSRKSCPRAPDDDDVYYYNC